MRNDLEKPMPFNALMRSRSPSGVFFAVSERAPSSHLTERHFGMDFMEDSLLDRCHEFVNFQQLLLQSPALHTIPIPPRPILSWLAFSRLSI